MNTITFEFNNMMINFNTDYTIPEELVGKTLIQTDLLPSSYFLFLQTNYNYLICLNNYYHFDISLNIYNLYLN